MNLRPKIYYANAAKTYAPYLKTDVKWNYLYDKNKNTWIMRRWWPWLPSFFIPTVLSIWAVWPLCNLQMCRRALFQRNFEAKLLEGQERRIIFFIFLNNVDDDEVQDFENPSCKYFEFFWIYSYSYFVNYRFRLLRVFFKMF